MSTTEKASLRDLINDQLIVSIEDGRWVVDPDHSLVEIEVNSFWFRYAAEFCGGFVGLIRFHGDCLCWRARLDSAMRLDARGSRWALTYTVEGRDP